MAQEDRLYGAQFAGITIAGISFLAVSESVEVEWTTDTGDARALKDQNKWPIGLIGGGTITGVFLVSTATGEGGDLFASALAKTVVSVSVQFWQGGDSKTFSATITSWKHASGNSPTDAQKINVTLAIQGAPS